MGDDPQNMLGAKFSIPYAVAAALVRGAADMSAFYPEALGDRRIRELASKVSVKLNPQMSMRRDDKHTARISILLSDGRQLSGTTAIVRGDAANPVPRQELVEKFLSLATDVLGSDRAQAVVEAVERLQELPNVRNLTSLLGDATLAKGAESRA